MKITGSKDIFYLSIIGVLIAAGYFGFYKNDQLVDKLPAQISEFASESPKISIPSSSTANSGYKAFVFDNFHGRTNISDKFKFQYPASWHNEGQYFSPEKIEYYTKFTVKAPIHFDLVLAEVFDQTELKYQIDNSKRLAPDMTGKIDGRDFRKYDLIDYGSYGGESAGRVKIFVGPEIKIDGADYILVFYWEEKPLAEPMPGNDVSVFDNMLLTLKFFK